MKRRDFSTGLAASSFGGFGVTAAALATPGLATAQGAPVEGQHYVKLSQPQPVLAAGKIEVLEFFWYGCPHCNAFEPALTEWVRRQSPDVAFRRVPVAFRDEPFGTHQRLYYTLETMGLLETLHKKVFFAIHNEHQRLDKADAIADFVAKNGVDRAKFLEVFNSFGVQTRQRQAKTLSEAYKIDGVPALGINGQYYTSGTLAGSQERALVVADYLIQRSRKG